MALDEELQDAIAIVGMAGRFPGASDLDQFWNNLRDGIESVRFFSEEELLDAGIDPALVSDPNYVKANAPLEQAEYFDADFFGFNPREAEILDPQQRIFLETCWHALEDAACVPSAYPGLIGVFAGVGGFNTYLVHNLLSNPKLFGLLGSYQVFLGNEKDFLATRASYKLNLKGPSLTLQTACSTSLVAVHLACQNLLTYQCDLALAGASRVSYPQITGYLYQEGMIFSPDGHCRPFDAQAKGTLPGDGVGVVALKRYEDAVADGDPIRALILGSAYNNDGSDKVGYSAPSVDGQTAAIASAQALAQIDPETISYIEAHGTGTPLGDPIEVQALTQAFSRKTAKKGYCAIGSLKGNVGHLDTVAGVAGLIKTVLSLENQMIPPSLHYEKPNPEIRFEESPFYVNAELSRWESESPRRAGVSSFGLGGTNAHLILQEASKRVSQPGKRPFQLLPLSAKNKVSLDALSRELGVSLENNKAFELADVAGTYQQGRDAFEYRRVVVASDTEDAARCLEGLEPGRIISGHAQSEAQSLAFLFAGGGSQYPNMGLELFQGESVYREIVEQGLAVLEAQHGLYLRQILYPTSEALGQAQEEIQKPSIALPALFLSQYALAKLLISWGLKPAAMIGHSMGEYVAACLAETITLADGLGLVLTRGKLFEQLPAGGMLSVPLSEKELGSYFSSQLSFAAVNGPELSVASGPLAEIDALERKLTESGIDSRRIKIAVAAHSSMIEQVLEPFREYVSKVPLKAPKARFLSNLSGTWIREEEACDPNYWVRHLRETVRFADGLQALLKEPSMALLEVGPGRTLSTLARQHPKKVREQLVLSTLRHPKEEISDYEFLLSALGKLWVAGVDLDWEGFSQGEKRQKLSLPGYQFDRKPYWIEAGAGALHSAGTDLDRKLKLDDWFSLPCWRQTALPTKKTEVSESCMLIADENEFSEKLACALREKGFDVVEVFPAEDFSQRTSKCFTISIEQSKHFRQLIEKIGRPSQIIHCLNLLEEDAEPDLPELKNRSFYSLLFLLQALAEVEAEAETKLCIVSNDLQKISSEKIRFPERALLFGPAKVAPLELENIRSKVLDISIEDQRERPAQLLELLLGEIAGDSIDRVVSFRGARRFVEEYQQVAIPAENTDAIFRQGGTYLISGGFGGIGAAIAKKIAKETKGNIILLGRNPKTEIVEEIEGLGARVLAEKVDISKLDQVQALAEKLKGSFGPIQGIIHAAGVLHDGALTLKEKEQAERVFAPKLEGTLFLEQVFSSAELKFFLLCSAASTIVGNAGQVDYVAANAFLNSLARARESSSETQMIAIDWGTWKEVGLAIRSQALSSSAQPSAQVKSYQLSTDNSWFLDEHRLQNGQAFLPGTAYIEMLTAAFSKKVPGAALELNDVFFLEAFSVENGQERELELRMFAEEETSYAFYGAGLEYARARIRVFSGPQADNIDINALRTDFHQEEQVSEDLFASSQMDFGPRWNLLRQVYSREGELLLGLELAKEYHSDLSESRLHPALLDVATGAAQRLISKSNSSEDFFVPLSYGRIVSYDSFTAACWSHLRLRSSEEISGNYSFDILILDQRGRVLVEIEQFVLRKLDAEFVLNVDRKPISQPEGVLAKALELGIETEQGLEACLRALASGRYSELAVVPISLSALQSLVEDVSFAEKEEVLHQRPSVSSEYVAPRTELESEIIAIWMEFLGLDCLGVYDDFFELGGHSLLFTRILARIRERYPAKLTLKDLFDTPTVAGLAGKIEASQAQEPKRERKKIRAMSREAYRA